MKIRIISTPQEAITCLRRFFTDNNVTDWSEDTDLRIAFRTAFQTTGLEITAVTVPGVPRVCLFTRILADVVVAPSSAHRLCNRLNQCSSFASAELSDEVGQFLLESSLVLDDGLCLEGQLNTFATGHMAAVVQIAPLLHAFARGRVDAAEADAWLAELAGGTAPEPRDDPAEDWSPTNRVTDPTRN